jgi:CDP-glycerol glycerophosphotransferase (TagB/SpsB family)
MSIRTNKIFQKIIKIINFHIPKNSKLIILYSPWRYNCNCYIFNKYLEENHKKHNFKFKFLSDFENKDTIKTLSIKGLWTFFRAKYILTTHGGTEVKVKRQTLIALGHGIAIKNIGLLDKKNQKFNNRRNVDFFISNSIITSGIYALAFDLEFKTFLEFGEPLLYFYSNIEKFLDNEDKNELKKIKNLRKKFKKIVLYTPTFRDFFNGRQTGDKIENILTKFLKIVEDNKNLYFVICLHPRDKEKFKNNTNFNKQVNVQFGKISSEKYLPFIDTNINDYSSFYFYSQYLEKENIIFIPDKKIYFKNVGLIYNNLEVFNPEVIFEKYNTKFKNTLQNYSETNKNFDKTIKDIYFSKKLKNSCEELLSFLNGKIK